MGYYVTDFGTCKIVGDRMELSAKQVTTMKSVFQRIITDIRENTKEQIATHGGRSGDRYEPLDYRTWVKKGSGRILYTVGARPGYTKIGGDALVRSVTVKGAAFQIARTSNEGFEFGTDRPYAYVHQHGSAARNIPARPFLHVLPEDVIKWDGMITAHLLLPFKNPVNPGPQ